MISSPPLRNRDIYQKIRDDHLGDRHAVEAFFKASGDINAKDAGGFTGLHHACLHKKMGMVKLLIHQKADVNEACDAKGNTPLM